MDRQQRERWPGRRKGGIRLWDESQVRADLAREGIDTKQLQLTCCLFPGNRGIPGREWLPAVSLVVLQEWTEAISQVVGEEFHPMHEMRNAIEDYLGENPIMASGASKARLICYFLKNYITPDPDFRDLRFAEKLSRAGKMALDFLQSTGAAVRPIVAKP